MAHAVVRGLHPAEARPAARPLAAAFHADPVMSWCFPRPERRAAALRDGFELLLRRHWRVPARTQLSLVPSLFQIARERAPRFARLLARVERKHPKTPHWYLASLGVEPPAQRRGLGSRLMHPILSRCDDERTPAYLEASSPRNRALYERHGFVTTEELSLPGEGPPIWLMWRKPG